MSRKYSIVNRGRKQIPGCATMIGLQGHTGQRLVISWHTAYITSFQATVIMSFNTVAPFFLVENFTQCMSTGMYEINTFLKRHVTGFMTGVPFSAHCYSSFCSVFGYFVICNTLFSSRGVYQLRQVIMISLYCHLNDFILGMVKWDSHLENVLHVKFLKMRTVVLWKLQDQMIFEKNYERAFSRFHNISNFTFLFFIPDYSGAAAYS